MNTAREYDLIAVSLADGEAVAMPARSGASMLVMPVKIIIGMRSQYFYKIRHAEDH